MDDSEEMRSTVAFSLRASVSKLRPRLGRLSVKKPGSHELLLETPGMFVSTSRGTVPHLTRDHLEGTEASKMIHVPFESLSVVSVY